MYGKRLDNREIVNASIHAPGSTAKLISELKKYSFREATSKTE